MAPHYFRIGLHQHHLGKWHARSKTNNDAWTIACTMYHGATLFLEIWVLTINVEAQFCTRAHYSWHYRMNWGQYLLGTCNVATPHCTLSLLSTAVKYTSTIFSPMLLLSKKKRQKANLCGLTKTGQNVEQTLDRFRCPADLNTYMIISLGTLFMLISQCVAQNHTMCYTYGKWLYAGKPEESI